jgi:hypothetical protein
VCGPILMLLSCRLEGEPNGRAAAQGNIDADFHVSPALNDRGNDNNVI